MPIDGISVITPTFGRVELVSQLIASCKAAGDRFRRPWELIIVDSSAEEAAGQLAKMCADNGVRYSRGPWRAGSKRNDGARLARFEILLFVDSDCTVAEDLFVEHARMYEQEGADFGGIAGVTAMHGETGLLWRILSRSREHNIPFSWPRYFARMQWATTSNLSVRRADFFEVGGFDEQTWTVTGCEDVDLGVRLWDQGHRLGTNDKAVVLHTRSEVTNPWQVMRKLSRHGQADVWICQKYPEQTEFRVNPIVVIGSAIAVGAGAAAVRRSLWPLVAGGASVPVMWLGTMAGRVGGLKGEQRHLEAISILIDWSLDYGIAKASIQHRRFGSMMRRFRYHSPSHFYLKPQYDRVPHEVFHAYGACYPPADPKVPAAETAGQSDDTF